VASSSAHVEYLGFSVKGATREYTLRVRDAEGDHRDFTMTITNDAFLAHRVRYQDAPDVCFRMLQRELLACVDGQVASRLSVTEADLEEYRVAQAPKPPQRRPKPPAPPQ
jgi:hypothetical protein